MAVTSQTELIQYCYRRLGAPLVEINVTDEQANDIVENALSFFREYYFDGIEKTYCRYLVTETDVANKYIVLPDSIYGVTRIFPGGGLPSSQTNIFDMQYQMRMNDFRDLTSTSLIYYAQAMSHIALLDNLLSTQKHFRFNRLNNKLFIDADWRTKIRPGAHLIIDCYSAIDPDDSPKFWDSRTLKDYCTAELKQQWGANIKKFSGITLPGGITLDGQSLYDEGKQEAEDIREGIMEKSSPLEFFVG